MSENNIKDHSKDEVVKDHSKNEVVKDHSKNEVVKDHSKDEVVKDHSKDEVVKDHSKDEVVKDHSKDEVVKDHSKDEVVKNIEKLIDVDEYKLDNIIVTSYTATWCGPCKRVKPYFLEFMVDYEKTSNKTINKNTYHSLGDEYKFVPFFVIKNITNNKDYKLQTSDPVLLKEFIENSKKINSKLEFNTDF